MIAYIALVLVTAYILIQGCKNYKKCSWGIYSLLLAVPLSSEALNTIELFRIGSVNVLEIAIIELFLLGIILNRIFKHIDKTFICVSILFFLYFVYVLFSIKQDRWIADAKDYIIPVLLFMCLRGSTEKTGIWDIFLKKSIHGIRINAIVVGLIYLLVWLPGGYSGRYGFACESLYVISIPIEFISWSKSRNIKGKRKDTTVAFCMAILELGLILTSQSRSLILCTLFIIVLHSVIDLGNSLSKKAMIKKLTAVFGIFMVLIIGYNYIVSHAGGSNGWVHRISEMLDNGLNTASNAERISLLTYYIPRIIAKPWGYGFGTSMPVWKYMANGTMAIGSGETLAVDNVLITYIYKVGILSTIIYIYIFLSALYRLISSNIFREKLNVIQISMITLIVPTILMSAQGLKNLTVACFWWAFVCGSCGLKYFKQK